MSPEQRPHRFVALGHDAPRQPLGPAILERIDVLVDGRYVEKRRIARGLRGSSNQVVHLLTPRHRMADVESTPVGEVLIGPDGEVRVSGVDPPGVPK